MNIQKIVLNDLNKILDEEIIRNNLKNIHFDYGEGGYEPGNYVYEDNGLYHYVGVGDRGDIEISKESKNVDEVLYEIYSDITFKEATKYAMINRKKGKDWRRILFAKQLEMLRIIGNRFYIKRSNAIQEILKSNPYNDNIV